MANHRNQLAGLQVGLLTVMERSRRDDAGRWLWRCQCSCGTEVERYGHLLKKALRAGQRASCGCVGSNQSHGILKTADGRRLKDVWSQMRRRCQDQGHKDYPNYGGRGIRVCEAWQSFPAFHAWAIAHGYQPGLTIERIDVDGDYTPENCTWIPNPQQALNRTNTHWVTWRGRTQDIRAWAEEIGIGYYTLRARLLTYGWPVERAMTTPAYVGRNQYAA